MEKVFGIFNRFTKRERTLLIALLIVGIVAVLLFLVALPALNYMTDLSAEVSKLQDKEVKYRTVISGTEDYEDIITTSEKRYNKLKKRFYLPMEPESLDEEITSLLVRSGFTPGDLEMTHLEMDTIAKYEKGDLSTIDQDGSGGQTADEGAADEETTEGEDVDTESEGEDSGSKGIITPNIGTEINIDISEVRGLGSERGILPVYEYIVGVKVLGAKSNLNKLLDIVNDTSGVEILTFSLKSGSKDATTGMYEKDEVKVYFSVYACIDSPDISKKEQKEE